jgi:hypothetical protein
MINMEKFSYLFGAQFARNHHVSNSLHSGPVIHGPSLNEAVRIRFGHRALIYENAFGAIN